MTLAVEPVSATIVEDRRDLEPLAVLLAHYPVFALDLEADGLHHYEEKLCLLQLSTPDENFVVDPLSAGGLGPLARVLADPAVEKVVHGCAYDLRLLAGECISLRNIFDTQIAAQLLGERAVGLGALLHRHLGVEVDKGLQKADWSARPLSHEMLEYAVRDTHHLLELRDVLAKLLEERGRLGWARQKFAAASTGVTALDRTGPLCQSFKGAGRFDRRGLAVLEGLLQMRDGMARQRDVPPFKVASNHVLGAIAEFRPQTLEELRRVPMVKEWLVQRMGRQAVAAVREAMRQPESRLPDLPSRGGRSRTRSVERRMEEALKPVRDELALELFIDAGVLCPAQLLYEVARADPRSMAELERVEGMEPWQREVLGRRFLEALNRYRYPLGRR